jgi:hypothetical protein
VGLPFAHAKSPLAFGLGEAEDSRMTPRAHKGTTAGRVELRGQFKVK